ncbi:MAG: PIN domain-containing protein [Planctomycetes bacterium]|nr:PIN domain-containing protein [Planctomycetota bacterium]
MAREIVYWDANCFLGLLNNEQDKIKSCAGAMKKAEDGKLVIVTSALTFIEVIRMKGRPKLKKSVEQTIQDFFSNSFIYIHNVDREVGIKARNLMWKHKSLQPKDSIHVATALLRNTPKLHTFDKDLLKLKDANITNKLKICKPDIEYQMGFDDLNGQEKEQTDKP